MEYAHGTDPTFAPDSFIGPTSDYVPIRLAVASCVKCHQTTLSAGPYRLTSTPPIRQALMMDTPKRAESEFGAPGDWPS